jgi:outer membrane protein TolC
VPGNAGNELYNLSSDSLQNLVSRSQQIHPELLKLNNKLASLEVERKLNREMIKPRLTFDYFPFRSYTAGNSDGVENIFANNYKFGVSFYSALFLRKERGNLQATNFKLKQMDFDLQLTKREIVNNVLASYNELQNLGNLITIQQTLVNNANTLRNAEETRFDNGESSLFLVNQRERSLIESQAKLVELKAKYAKAKIMLQWSSGIQMFD